MHTYKCVIYVVWMEKEILAVETLFIVICKEVPSPCPFALGVRESNIELVDIKGQPVLIPLCLKGSLHTSECLCKAIKC
jgi:hypothetical protein